jgi:hypothetical protein
MTSHDVNNKGSLFYLTNLFFIAQHPLVGLIIQASQSPSDTPHSVGLLWMSDQPDAETSTLQNTTLTRDRYPCPQRESKPQSQLQFLLLFQFATSKGPLILIQSTTVHTVVLRTIFIKAGAENGLLRLTNNSHI